MEMPVVFCWSCSGRGRCDRQLGAGAAIGAIGGLVSGAVQQLLESGNDCGCGK
jgi:hypothetical protein